MADNVYEFIRDENMILNNYFLTRRLNVIEKREYKTS